MIRKLVSRTIGKFLFLRPKSQTPSEKQSSHLDVVAPGGGRAAMLRDVEERLSAKDWTGAEERAGKLIARHVHWPKGYSALASSLRAQKKWRQEVAALEKAIAVSPSPKPIDWFRLAQAQEQMLWHRAAAASYEKAISLKDAETAAVWHYRLGYVLDVKGTDGSPDPATASLAYDRAIAADTKQKAGRFGIGVFHQSRGYWQEAANAYATQIEKSGGADPDLYYRAGFSFDRCYEWAEAEHYINKAVSLSGQNSNWWYRLGFVLERQGKFREAAEAYATAIDHSTKHAPYWIYRMGYVQEKAGEARAACLTFLKLFPDTETSSRIALEGASIATKESFYEMALQTDERAATDVGSRNNQPDASGKYAALPESWEDAAQYYQDAILRANDHTPELYYALGRALTCVGNYAQACETFRSVRVLQRPHGLNEAQAKLSESKKRLQTYAEYLAVLPIRPKTILFESFNGANISCNPYALYRCISKDDRFSDYRFIWTCNDSTIVPDGILADPRVALARRESDLYLRSIATCEYLINNNGFPPYFIRRDQQKFLSTWHGTPLKTLGKRQKNKFFDHKRAQRNFLQATHIISPNQHTTNVFLDDYDLRGIYSGLIAETGYPRVDKTINLDGVRRSEIVKILGLSGERPIVFYAPTWRGTLQGASIDIDRLRRDIGKFPKNADVVFRGHSLLETYLEGVNLGCIVAPNSVDSNEILAIADVVITDYSSILFDYIPRNRSLVLYVYDQEEYESERGLYFDLEDMPGIKVRTHDDLIEVLENILNSGNSKLRCFSSAVDRFCPHDDGCSSYRVMSFLFDDDRSFVIDHQDEKKNILVYQGNFAANGISATFAHLHNSFPTETCRLITLFEPFGPEFDPEKRKRFNRLDAKFPFIPRFGAAVGGCEENWLRGQYNRTSGAGFSGERLDLLHRFFARDYRRVTGLARVDAIVSYSGSDLLVANILSCADQKILKTVLLHNDV